MLYNLLLTNQQIHIHLSSDLFQKLHNLLSRVSKQYLKIKQHLDTQEIFDHLKLEYTTQLLLNWKSKSKMYYYNYFMKEEFQIMENLLNEFQEHYILLIIITLNFWSLITSKIIIQSIFIQLMAKVEKVSNKEREVKMMKEMKMKKIMNF